MLSIKRLNSLPSDSSRFVVASQTLIICQDGYIKATPLSAVSVLSELLNSIKDDIKAQYGNQVSNDEFEASFKETLSETVQNTKWKQDKPNHPIKADVKKVITDFLTNITNKLGKVAEANKDSEFTFETAFAKEHKEELKTFVGEIFANDAYAATTLEAFTEREIDTFIDSVITEAHKENPKAEDDAMLEAVKKGIQERLAADPLAPLNVTENLMNTHNALLSAEEKAIKADIKDIEQDQDPTKIDGSGVDYSKMPNADAKIADVSGDWELMDMDTALNSRNMFGTFSKDTSAALIYSNLETLRPQLKAMVEENFTANGKEFNEDVVDKYINYFMTETLREGIQAKYHDTLPELYPNTILSGNATLKDLGELLTTKVKDELAEGDGAFGTKWQSQDIDPLLCATSDYFLTAEERMQKQEMEYKKSGF